MYSHKQTQLRLDRLKLLFVINLITNYSNGLSRFYLSENSLSAKLIVVKNLNSHIIFSI